MKTADRNVPIRVGRLNGPWGVSGWVKVFSYTDPPENIFEYQPWRTDGSPGLLHVREWRRQGPRLVARIDEIETREDAERLEGLILEIDPAQLPPPGPDSYYWQDLIGLEAVDAAGAPLGVVHDLLDAGVHDVLIIRRPDGAGDLLVPFVLQRYVLGVDRAAGRITVDWDPEWTDAD